MLSQAPPLLGSLLLLRPPLRMLPLLLTPPVGWLVLGSVLASLMRLQLSLLPSPSQLQKPPRPGMRVDVQLMLGFAPPRPPSGLVPVLPSPLIPLPASMSLPAPTLLASLPAPTMLCLLRRKRFGRLLRCCPSLPAQMMLLSHSLLPPLMPAQNSLSARGTIALLKPLSSPLARIVLPALLQLPATLSVHVTLLLLL